MDASRKNYKILFAKHGKIWLEDGGQAMNRENTPLVATYLSSEEAQRRKSVSIKQVRKKSFVSYKDFEDLKTEFKKMKQLVEQIQASKSSEGIDFAVDDALFQLKQIKDIKEIRNNSKDKKLFFQVESENFSGKLLRKIADIEINLARKYQDFSVEIRPTIPDKRDKQSNCD